MGLGNFYFCVCHSKASNNIASILDCNAFIVSSCLNACLVLKVISAYLSNCRHFLSKGSYNGYGLLPCLLSPAFKEVMGCSSTKLHVKLRAGNAGCHFFRRDIFQ